MEKRTAETSVLRIKVLGPFQAWHYGEILTWPTQKSKALFQILLVEPGKLVPNDQILEYLWPNLPPIKAQNNLWVTVSQLRRVLQPDLPPRTRSDFIEKRGEGYRFNSESNYWLDGDAIATHLAKAQSKTNLTAHISALEAAQTLYQGDYLEDEPYAEWAQVPRTQWHRRYKQLLVSLAQAHGRNGNIQQAITLCHEVLTLDNTNETAYRLLMRCYTTLGERSTALKVYEEAVQALRDEIGVDPMPETSALAQQIKLSDGDWALENKNWTVFDSQSQISSPFVGRGEEVDQLTQLLTKAATDQGQMALIKGEPGIGKSRLVHETSVLAHQKGFHLLSAHCFQVEQTIPYQPLIDLVHQVTEQDNHWQELELVWLRELAVLSPEMGEFAATSTAVALPSDEPDESQQGRLFQSIFHLFALKAKQQKLLLVVEDIHWADPATLQCLHYLTRRITQVPIVLIISMREENISTNGDLNTMIQSLRRETHFTSFSLSRLTEDNTSVLLAQANDTEPYANQLSHWLFQETDGNPFFITSLLQSIRENGLLDNVAKTDWTVLARTDPTLTLPDAIRDLVRDRLQKLSQGERDTLDWMAVYDRPIDFSTLQAISKHPQMTLLNLVEQLYERRLLIETTGQYDFDHNKIREVVYDDLSSARRRLYHQQIANTLEGLSSSPKKASILAHHFERGGENEKALAFWLDAGKYALDTYAYQQTTQHYERALALADQPATQMEAYLGLAQAFILQDDHKAATTVIKQGLLLAERYGDDAHRSRLLFVQAQNANRQHRTDGGQPEVEAALVAAEQVGDEYYIAQSLLLLTEVHESNGNMNSALETATQAQIVSSKLNDNQLEARALVEIGFLHAQRAEFIKAANAAEMGLKLLAKTDDRNAIAYAWNILGRALGGSGNYSRALGAFQRSNEEAQIISDRYLLAQVFNMQGWLHRELGDYESALKFDTEGIDFSKQWGKPSPEISARLNVCLDILHLGDPDKAIILLDEIEMQINTGSFGFHRWRWQLRLLRTRGLCYLALDVPKKALETADDGLLLAESKFSQKYVALNHELRGKALAKLGNTDEAIAELQAAISLSDVIQYQPIRWAGRYQLVNLYLQNDLEQEAKNVLSEAEEIVQTIAASLDDENLRNVFLNSARPQ